MSELELRLNLVGAVKLKVMTRKVTWWELILCSGGEWRGTGWRKGCLEIEKIWEKKVASLRTWFLSCIYFWCSILFQLGIGCSRA